MAQHLYSFVLKTKRGEFEGLNRAGPLLRDIGRPHFEVTRSKEESELQGHLDDVCSEMRRCWSLERDFYVDLFDIPLTWRLERGTHPLRYIADRVQGGDLFEVRLIPTTGLAIERDAAYVDAAKQVARDVGRGLCLRLKPEEIEHYEESTGLAGELLEGFPEPCDLLLDYRSIVNQDVQKLAGRGVRLVRALESRGLRFREIIVCGSNMPEKLSEHVDKESRWNQPRLEWTLWERVAYLLSREVVYGDYSVVFPEFFGAQKNRHINAKLRIADKDHYRLYRGRELYTEDGDPLQYRELAGEVLRIDGMRLVQSKAIEDLKQLSLGRGGKVGSPGSLVATEVCLHLDITAQEVLSRSKVVHTAVEGA